MQLLKTLQPKDHEHVIKLNPGVLVQLKEDIEGTSMLKGTVPNVEGAVIVDPPLNGYKYWRLEELELTQIHEAKLASDKIFLVSVPATVFNGRHYEFGSAQVKVMASSAEEAMNLVNSNKDDVVRFLGTRRVQPSGKPLLDPKCAPAKCVFFKDTYYVKTYPAKSSRDVMTRHGGFKVVKLQEQVESTSLLKQIDEGMWVVKSKDGVEKRFKDVDSPEAKAWKESTAKKPTAPKEKFTAEWWDHKAQKDQQGGNFDGIYPWTKIDRHLLDAKDIEAAVKDAGFNMKNVDDFNVTGKADKKIDGVDCAGVKIRVAYSFDKDDDMGVDGPVSDAQSIIVVRSPKNPAKLIFAGYAH